MASQGPSLIAHTASRLYPTTSRNSSGGTHEEEVEEGEAETTPQRLQEITRAYEGAYK